MKNQTTIKHQDDLLSNINLKMNGDNFHQNEICAKHKIFKKSTRAVSKLILWLVVFFAFSNIVANASPLVITVVRQNIKCYGGNSGSLNVNVIGGHPYYTYTWSNGTTNQDLTGLSIGTYTLTVTDSYGISKTKTFILTEPTQLVVTVAGDINDPTIATAYPIGGKGLYTYKWNAKAAYQTTQTATGLVANNTYVVMVKDANFCKATGSISMKIAATQPTENTIRVFPNPSKGKINVEVNSLEEGNVTVSLYNMIGQETFKQTVFKAAGSFTPQFDFLAMPKGMYLIKIQTSDGDSLKQLVLE